ncbi:MAG: ATP-binding protein [Alistipes sp.]|nr:ATP-binding protein [Alistipes sp.]
MKDVKVYIDQISFNDGSSFNFGHSDIVVFTGSNNSGKSQVLRDIKSYFAKKEAIRVVASDVKAWFGGDIQKLANKCINKDGYYYLHGIHVGTKEDLVYNWNNRNVSNIHNLFINYLSTEDRLNKANPAKSFNALLEAPKHPIQQLYIDDEQELNLSTLFHQAFGSEIIVNRGAGSQIPIHMGAKPTIEEGEDRVSRSYLQKLSQLPLIQNQGDGMRSFTGILLDAFTSDYDITLIDEPEAFLHPPQARLLGKMLAKNAPINRQLFISTHSEDFLKGLLDADNENVKIIRINREGNINHMSILNNDDIKNLWQDPILRYSNILSGLFHSKVVVCESDTDCRFYQAILSAINDDDSISPDVLFTHCGGKQRLKTVIKALKSLNVKTVAITDIDVLNDKKIFQEIIETSGEVWDNVETQWKIISEYVKSQRAQLDTEEVKSEIDAIFKTFNEPQLTTEITNKIKKVIKMSSAWSKVKETGKAFFSGDAYKAFSELYDRCKSYGILIVPVGELECFYKPDANHGTKWVNNVLESVDLKNDAELDTARRFVREILAI